MSREIITRPKTRHGVTLVASERATTWELYVTVEFKDAAGGGRVWKKSLTNLDQLKAALLTLGIEL